MQVTDQHIMWILGIIIAACTGFITVILGVLGYFLKSFKEDVGHKLDAFSQSLVEFGNKTVAIATSLEHSMNAHAELKTDLKAHEQFCAVEFKDNHTRIINLENKIRHRITQGSVHERGKENI